MLLEWGKDLDRLTEQVDRFVIDNPECLLVVGSTVFSEFREGARSGAHDSLYEHPNCVKVLLSPSVGNYIVEMGYTLTRCILLGLMWGNIPIAVSNDIDKDEIRIISINKDIWNNINEVLEGPAK